MFVLCLFILSFLFFFLFGLNVAPISTRKEIIPMRIRSSYIVSQSITTTFIFFLFFFFYFFAFLQRERNKFTGAFRFYLIAVLSPSNFYAFFFLRIFHIHIKHLLINHLFRLVYYVTSINYPFFSSVLGFCFWLIWESCWTFVYNSFIYWWTSVNNLLYSGAKRWLCQFPNNLQWHRRKKASLLISLPAFPEKKNMNGMLIEIARQLFNCKGFFLKLTDR